MWNKEVGRLAEGVSLIAKETLKRSQTLNLNNSKDLSSFFTFSLKNTLFPITDILGLTKGNIKTHNNNSTNSFEKRDLENKTDVALSGSKILSSDGFRDKSSEKIGSFSESKINIRDQNGNVGSEKIGSFSESKINIRDQNGNIGSEKIGSLSESKLNVRDDNGNEIGGKKIESLLVGDEKNRIRVSDDINVVKNDEKNEKVVSEKVLKKNRRPRERRVPSTPFSRALGFAGLGAGLAWGTVQESAKRLVYGHDPKDKQSAYSPFLSDSNAERLALALCRMRGAALKIGQMLSIQDESLVPPPILAALDIVRQGADVMPKSQLDQVLDAELGPNWSSKLIEFDYAPLAAASIGQVHRAVTEDGVDVAVKIQYPGVADSIESDIENVKLLLNYTNLIPKGLFLDSAIKVAKQELARECDYELELANQKRFRDFLFQTEGFYVPKVMDNISSKRVITTEFVAGIPIDKVASLSQETRNYVGRKMLELALKELFVFRFMQTDPNWSNFLFDEETNTINLIDFGAARDYPKGFVDNYLRMVMACANSEREPVLEMSKRLGFLTGMESEIMMDAHVQAAFVVGLPFSKPGLYDFRAANITQSVSNLGATMLRHRLTPPPDEAYSLHRKLSGAFLACMKIGAVVPCRDLLLEIYQSYQFGEDGDDVLSSGLVS